MAAGNVDGNRADDLVMDFGSPSGLWIYHNMTSWSRLHSLSAEQLVIGDLDGSGIDDIVVDFGPGGVWILQNGGGWVLGHETSPELMIVAQLN